MTIPPSLLRLIPLILAVGIYATPVPEGLVPQAWHLFALFAGAIVAVVVGALPILTAAILALGAAVVSGTLAPADAYAGFSHGTILLIVIAFLVARAVMKCGLGERIAHLVVGRFGRSSLGLVYSIFLVDAVIAPAFPSNTARSGVLYPLAYSLAETAGATPERPERRKLGGLLMFAGMGSLSLSSSLWLTAMAANPLGADIAKAFGVKIDFVSWFIASSLPTLTAMVLLPLLLYRLLPPEVTATPEAPARAREALRELGPLRRREKVVIGVFTSMVASWAASAAVGVDATAVAFLGLAALLMSDVLTLEDISQEGEVLATYIWFASLFALSTQLNTLGFTGYVGERLASAMGGLSWPLAGLALLLTYVLLHYLFVSQTAHQLALLGVFLGVGVSLGVPTAPLAFLLLFATNFFSVITPQGSSANLLFVGPGFLSHGELYRLGAQCTAFLLLIYVVVGAPWLAWVTR